MRTYVGVRDADDVRVTVHTATGERPLRHILYHSETGMEWGYPGNGPADLALSILVDALGESRRWQLRSGDVSFGFLRGRSRVPLDSKAWNLHQEFKHDVVARFRLAEFVVTDTQVLAWITRHKQAPAPDAMLDI